MITQFAEEFSEALDKYTSKKSPYKRIVIATGTSAYKFMCEVAEASKWGSRSTDWCFKSWKYIFGKTITVAGLLTGGDITNALMNCGECDMVMLPEVMFRNGTEIFLDDIKLSEVREKTGKKIKKVPVDGDSFMKTILGLDKNRKNNNKIYKL